MTDKDFFIIPFAGQGAGGWRMIRKDQVVGVYNDPGRPNAFTLVLPTEKIMVTSLTWEELKKLVFE